MGGRRCPGGHTLGVLFGFRLIGMLMLIWLTAEKRHTGARVRSDPGRCGRIGAHVPKRGDTCGIRRQDALGQSVGGVSRSRLGCASGVGDADLVGRDGKGW